MAKRTELSFIQKIIFGIYIKVLPLLPKKQRQSFEVCYKSMFNQREIATTEYQQKSKRPQNNDLTFHSLCLGEIYFVEDLDKLEKNLDNMYTDKGRYDTQRTIESYKDFINNCNQYFNYGGYCNL